MTEDFAVDLVLRKPLMAHLATTHDGAPRSSPVWFLYRDGFLWLFGTRRDSFVKRLKQEPRCALSIADFDLEPGVLLHVGIRGTARVTEVDAKRLDLFVSKYLGEDKSAWNTWFVKHVVDPIDQMVQVIPESTVAKNVSYFKTGPDFAKPPQSE